LGDDILYRIRLTIPETRQLVQALPLLSPVQRQQLESEYLAEVMHKYEFWRTHYTPIAAVVRLLKQAVPGSASMPREFLPRGFDVLVSTGSRVTPKSYRDLRKAIDKHGHLILIGEPGVGKTTTLWRLMLDYSQRAERNSQCPLPVLLSLGRYRRQTEPLEFVRGELLLASKGEKAIYPAHRRLAAHLEEYLEDGRLILLFDALNEMSQRDYAASVGTLEAFRNAHPGLCSGVVDSITQ
jgi:predicted NACHT family NTPase